MRRRTYIKLFIADNLQNCLQRINMFELRDFTVLMSSLLTNIGDNCTEATVCIQRWKTKPDNDGKTVRQRTNTKESALII